MKKIIFVLVAFMMLNMCFTCNPNTTNPKPTSGSGATEQYKNGCTVPTDNSEQSNTNQNGQTEQYQNGSTSNI